ncbi:MAG: alpha/beta fold hydrolase [Actinomycetota bacterium]
MSIVLIPGAGGSGWSWHRVAPFLEEAGHEVVRVDLPGSDDSAGLADYANAVVDAIGARTDLTVVAQSLGAFTAPLVCDRVPVSMLVLVNPMIPSPGETAGDWWANTGQPEAKAAYAEQLGLPAHAFDMRLDFFHDVPDEVFAAAGAHARPQSQAIFGEPWPLATWPDVPTRVLQGRGDRFFPLEFQRRIARERLGVTPDEIDGGHLVALSNPQQLADRILNYVRDGSARHDIS